MDPWRSGSIFMRNMGIGTYGTLGERKESREEDILENISRILAPVEPLIMPIGLVKGRFCCIH